MGPRSLGILHDPGLTTPRLLTHLAKDVLPIILELLLGSLLLSRNVSLFGNLTSLEPSRRLLKLRLVVSALSAPRPVFLSPSSALLPNRRQCR